MGAGLAPADLWDLAPREIDHILRGATWRDERLAWLSARYVLVAVNDPKEFPSIPKIADFQAPSGSADTASARIAKIRREVRLSHDTAKAKG